MRMLRRERYSRPLSCPLTLSLMAGPVECEIARLLTSKSDAERLDKLMQDYFAKPDDPVSDTDDDLDYDSDEESEEMCLTATDGEMAMRRVERAEAVGM